MPKKRWKTRRNAELGRRLRADIREAGLPWRDECGAPDPTGSQALAWIAYPQLRRKEMDDDASSTR